jgi:hypothetical protein
MRTIVDKLRPAQQEVQKTAHDQDLIEVPKRARLDREAEHKAASRGTPWGSEAPVPASS